MKVITHTIKANRHTNGLYIVPAIPEVPERFHRQVIKHAYFEWSEELKPIENYIDNRD